MKPFEERTQVFADAVEGNVEKSDPWGCDCSSEFETECDRQACMEFLKAAGWELVLIERKIVKRYLQSDSGYIWEALHLAMSWEEDYPGKGLDDLRERGIELMKISR